MNDNLVVPLSDLDASIGDLVLRVCEPSGNGRLLRLKSLRCSIDSGWHCTLRLGTHGAQGANSLILRGPGGAVLRCWSPDTRLNGLPFAGHDLAPGDRLMIGPVELEVLEPVPLAAAPDVAAPDAEPDPVEEAPELLAPKLEQLAPELAEEADEDGEESVDQYMARLLKRTRTSTDQPATPSGPPPEDKQEAKPPPSTAIPSGANVVIHPQTSRPPDLERLPPRASAPESEAGLLAMRELANLSARSAISHHRRRTLILTSRTKLAVASVALACCGVLAWLWWKADSGILSLYAAVAGLIIAVYWGTECAIAAVGILRNKRNRVDWDDSPRG